MSTQSTPQATSEPTPDLAEHHYPQVYEQLLGYVKDHRMEVLHEDGLYRHLRFATPGTVMGHFYLVTWPGHLTIVGDIGSGWTFRRDEDMLSWFHAPEGMINPGYWSEKVTGSRRDYRDHSGRLFTEYVKDRVDEAIDYHDLDERHALDLQDQVATWVLGEAYDQTMAYQGLDAFAYHCNVMVPAVTYSSTNRSLTQSVNRCTCAKVIHSLDSDIDPQRWEDFDHHFLMACHAILWGTRRYYESKGES